MQDNLTYDERLRKNYFDRIYEFRKMDLINNDEHEFLLGAVRCHIYSGGYNRWNKPKIYKAVPNSPWKKKLTFGERCRDFAESLWITAAILILSLVLSFPLSYEMFKEFKHLLFN